jgi:hypothetical protein
MEEWRNGGMEEWRKVVRLQSVKRSVKVSVPCFLDGRTRSTSRRRVPKAALAASLNRNANNGTRACRPHRQSPPVDSDHGELIGPSDQMHSDANLT